MMLPRVIIGVSVTEKLDTPDLNSQPVPPDRYFFNIKKKVINCIPRITEVQLPVRLYENR